MRLDRTRFAHQSLREADDQRIFWAEKTWKERLEAGWMLSAFGFGIDPNEPPPMRKDLFSKRKQA